MWVGRTRKSVMPSPSKSPGVATSQDRPTESRPQLRRGRVAKGTGARAGPEERDVGRAVAIVVALPGYHRVRPRGIVANVGVPGSGYTMCRLRGGRTQRQLSVAVRNRHPRPVRHSASPRLNWTLAAGVDCGQPPRSSALVPLTAVVSAKPVPVTHRLPAECLGPSR